MLNISIAKTEIFDKVESIDEFAEIIGWTHEGQEGVDATIYCRINERN